MLAVVVPISSTGLYPSWTATYVFLHKRPQLKMPSEPYSCTAIVQQSTSRTRRPRTSGIASANDRHNVEDVWETDKRKYNNQPIRDRIQLDWIPIVDTHKQLICQRTKRAMTNPRPCTESSR